MDWLQYVLIGIVVLWLIQRLRPVPGLKNIQAHTLRKKMNKDKLKIVDVREPAEFRSGHIHGAINIPLGRIPYVAQKYLSPEDEIVLVCRSGNRSKQAARKLRKMGYRKLNNLVGGMMAWK
ncbi:Rhodanese-like protein [Caldalkalibacillus thermarum TA2.A1]|uniref:Rhodanese-like domain-containing protein n=1 Tax=Caldalkalibacillus thermarum (strain TA2.A1) TaxID=986075 RepID=F5L8K8_CALTT|nr:rhodanese-like domain-containing protein [Caldalkalibacillus thermarum]EGL82347.1 Rhodanese-like protein [Caldalkalibacillus thermarum TA2.A1]QZT32910.1 rhodanese-like domain-containing protein [Caldalkalibacillus thermarum TA2.A1]